MATQRNGKLSRRYKRHAGALRARSTKTLVILALTLVIMVGTVVAATMYAIQFDRERTVSNAKLTSANIATLVAYQSEDFLRGVDRFLVTCSRTAIVGDRLEPSHLMQLIGGQDLVRDQIRQIAVADADGNVIFSSLGPLTVPVNLADKRQFRLHQGGYHGLAISQPSKGEVSGLWSIQVSRALLARNRAFLGVAYASIDPGQFLRAFDEIDLRSDGVVTVLGLDGDVRARSARAHGGVVEFSNINVSGGPLMQAYQEGRTDWIEVESIIDHIRRIYTIRPMHGLPLLVVVGVSKSEVFAAFERRRSTLITLAALVTFLSAAGCIAIAANVTLSNRHVSAMEAMNRALQRAREAAEQGARAKTTFLAHMSHELRTPLNAILGFSELIRMQTSGPAGLAKYAEYADDIHSSGMHLLSLINDVLDVSKIEAGKFILHPSSIRLSELIESCVGMVKEMAAKSDVRLEAEVSPDLPPIYADERSMKQVVLNLLSNAIKYAPGGQVRVSAIGDGGSVQLEVSDNGLGMTSSEIGVALEPFGQIPRQYLVSRSGGSGLGLPIAKSLAELNGARFELTSALGGGTSVRVWLTAVLT